MSINYYSDLIIGVEIKKEDVFDKEKKELTKLGERLGIECFDNIDNVDWLYFNFNKNFEPFECLDVYDSDSDDIKYYLGIVLDRIEYFGVSRIVREDAAYYYNELVKMLLQDNDLKALIDNKPGMFLVLGRY